MPRFAAGALLAAGLASHLLAPAAAGGLVRLPVRRVVAAQRKPEARGDALFAGAPFGDVEIGTPGQMLNVVFDTGLSNLWVASKPRGLQLAQRTYYTPRASNSYEATGVPFRIEYGSGPVSGAYCRDDVALGQLKLPSFTFAEVNDTTALPIFDTSKFDGVLGLGFPRLSEGGVPPTVMGALVKSGQLEEPVFGFYLPSGQPGQLVLGGVDPDHFVGDFHFVNVSRAAYWAVQLDGVTLGGIRIVSTAVAIVDSGTSLLAGPTQDVRELATMMGATEVQGLYTVSCGRDLPSMTFTLGGKDYLLDQNDLVVQEADGVCVLGLQGSPGGEWILGDVFLRKFYVQFDWGRQRVGFAKAAPGPAAPSAPGAGDRRLASYV